MRSPRPSVCRTLHRGEELAAGLPCARAWHPRCNPRAGMQFSIEIPSRGKAYRAHAVLHRLFASFRLAVVVAAPGGA